MDNADKLNHFKVIIHSLAVPYKHGVSVRSLFREFQETEGRPFPCKQFGFYSELDFLKSFPDTFKVKISDCYADEQDYIVFAVAGSDIEHIDKMVIEQKEEQNAEFNQRVVHRLTFSHLVFPKIFRHKNDINNHKPFSLNTSSPQEELIPLEGGGYEFKVSKSAAVCPLPKNSKQSTVESNNVRKLLTQHGSGVLLINFARLYNIEFGRDLDFMSLGFKTMKDFLSSIDFVKVEKINDFFKVSCV